MRAGVCLEVQGAKPSEDCFQASETPSAPEWVQRLIARTAASTEPEVESAMQRVSAVSEPAQPASSSNMPPRKRVHFTTPAASSAPSVSTSFASKFSRRLRSKTKPDSVSSFSSSAATGSTGFRRPRVQSSTAPGASSSTSTFLSSAPTASTSFRRLRVKSSVATVASSSTFSSSSWSTGVPTSFSRQGIG